MTAICTNLAKAPRYYKDCIVYAEVIVDNTSFVIYWLYNNTIEVWEQTSDSSIEHFPDDDWLDAVQIAIDLKRQQMLAN